MFVVKIEQSTCGIFPNTFINCYIFFSVYYFRNSSPESEPDSSQKMNYSKMLEIFLDIQEKHKVNKQLTRVKNISSLEHDIQQFEF